jgi:HYR domain
VLGLSVRFTVADKGTIDVTTAPSTDCQPEEQNVTHHFPSATITGGSLRYAGASGSGTLRKTLIPGSTGAFGKDTWDMTLLVPGLAFDITPPVLRGAVAKTVVAARRVRLVRVTYRITALDETDGSVLVACTPRTGSRFKIGRTVVNCSAMDKSGNTGRTRFTVAVRARR